MQNLPAGVQAGAVVEARGQAWQVSRIEPFAQCALLTLDGRGPHNQGERMRLISPFDRATMPSGVQRLRCRRRNAVLRGALAAVAGQQPATGLWCAGQAAIDILPWQLAPALAVLQGATRLLLADAVGLGKTIQAGLILAELHARGLLSRALVLTPAGLRTTWAGELRQRFNLPALVIDHAALATMAAELPAGVNPWRSATIVVSSIDLVKRAEVWAAVEACPLDVLVIDEAHHLTPGSARAALARQLAARTPWLVLLSATPHAGDDGAFAFLADIGRCSPTEPAMAIFRRTRTAVGLATSRRSHTLVVRPTVAERALFEGVQAYASALWRSGTDAGGASRLLATVLARRAASSATAIALTLQRRLAALGGPPAAPDARQSALPWVEGEDDDTDASMALLAARGFEDVGAERSMVTGLVALAEAARPTSSKMHRLVRLITRVQEPMVVFTEFRDTLEAAARLLRQVARVVCIHGGLDAPTRQQAVQAFTHGCADVLLATDAAGEGLNLHHRCRLVVTLEWPWSPRRLEQRIGRVDRIGQTRTVHAIHLTQQGTVEETVLAHLLRRRHIASTALNDLATSSTAAPGTEFAPRSDEAIAAAAIHGVVEPAPAHWQWHWHWRVPVVPGLAAEAVRLLHSRHLRHQARAPAAIGGSWARPRRHALVRPSVMAVFEVSATTAAGLLQSRTLVPLRLRLATVPATRRQWRLVMSVLVSHPAVLATVRTRAPVVEGAVATAGDRIRHIQQHRRRAIVTLVQTSLFDGHAQRVLERRETTDADIDAHLARLSTFVDAEAAAPQVRLLAAWPEV